MQAGSSTENAMQPDDRGDEPRPGRERHPRERHPLGAQVQGRRDEVERAQQLTDTEDRDRYRPQRLPHALSRAGVLADGAERGIGGPPRERRPVRHEEGGDQHQEGHEGHPERHHVEAGEGHVLGADLNGQDVVAEAGERRGGQHEEHHDRAVHRHQRQVQLRRHDARRPPRWAPLAQARDGDVRDTPGGSASARTAPCRSPPRPVPGRDTVCR